MAQRNGAGVAANIDIDAYINELRITVMDAGLHYDVWSVLTKAVSEPKCQKDMNRYSLFFSTSIRANLVATLIALYCLYDTHQKTYNINDLLKQVRCRFTTEEGMNDIEVLYVKAKHLWQKVNILRNNVFGHRSTLLTIEKGFVKANVTPEELNQLIETSKDLLNKVSFLHNQTKHTFNLDARRDTLDMLKALSCVIIKRSTQAGHE